MCIYIYCGFSSKPFFCVISFISFFESIHQISSAFVPRLCLYSRWAHQWDKKAYNFLPIRGVNNLPLMINCLKDPLHVLMRVLLSTILNADDDDNAYEEVNHVDGHRNWVRDEDDIVDTKEDETQSGGHIQKSSLRKVDSNSTVTVKKEKKKVQWVDVIGKELAEIREFEASEEGDVDYDRGKSCVCVIL